MRADDSAALLTGAAVLLNRLTAWATAHRGLVAGFELRLHHESRRRMIEDPASAHHRAGDRPGRAGGRHRPPALAAARAPAAPAARRVGHRAEPALPLDRAGRAAQHRAVSVGRERRRRLAAPARTLRGPARRAQHPAPATGGRPPPRAGHRRAPGRRGVAHARTPARHAAEPRRARRPRGLGVRRPGPLAAPQAPVWLLREPQPLRDEGGTPLLSGQPLWLVAGPERIEAGWWDGGYAARDYFIAQDHRGALLWVYRFRRAPEVGEVGWYLQGRFG